MLSRRNIRIKIMQILYAQNRTTGMTREEVLRAYRRSIEQSQDLFLFNLDLLFSVAEFAEEIKRRKKDKFRPTADDLSFEPRLATNPVSRSVLGNMDFQRLADKKHFATKYDESKLQTLYADFAATPDYQVYLKSEADEVADRETILVLYKKLLKTELFHALLQDNFPNWIDDDSHIIGAMKKTIKALPSEGHFWERHYPTEETTEEFGETLLIRVLEDEDELRAKIDPMLKNWAADRVAVIDMILLKMALAEMLHFSSIPTKVTINEYVEVSKMYSTEKSKDFINGILDRLMKQLLESGEIAKAGRGLKG